MVLIWIPIIAFVVIGPLTAVYACIMLSKPGINHEVRSLILSRHVQTMIFFLVVNLYAYIGFFIVLLPQYRGYQMHIKSNFVLVLKFLYQC